jgi:hypothetical protein
MKGPCVYEGKCHVPPWAAQQGHATMEACYNRGRLGV